MDIQFFLNILGRRKWLILLAIIAAALATFVLISFKADKYKSDALISTNILGAGGLDVSKNSTFIQKNLVEMSFGNLTEFIKSRRNVKYLSYRLLLHDLAPDSLWITPFRDNEEFQLIKARYSEEDLASFRAQMTANLDILEHQMPDTMHQNMFYEFSEALEYDYESLLNDLLVYKSGNTDNLKVEYTSENPELCEFVVNNYTKDFLRTHISMAQKEEFNKVKFYRKLVSDKKKELDNIDIDLTNFRRNRGLIDQKVQTDAVISQINDKEEDLEDLYATISTLKKNIRDLNRYIDAEEDKTPLRNNNSSSKEQKNAVKILNLRNQIEQLDKEIILANKEAKRERLKKRRSHIENELKYHIERNAEFQKDKNDAQEKRAETSRRDFFGDRVEKELELTEAEERAKSLEVELSKLRNRSISLVSDESFLENLAGEKEITLNSYISLTNELRQAELIMEDKVEPLSILEYPQIPKEPEPSGKLMYSAFAGILSGIFCTVILFILAFLDMSLHSPHQFKKFAQINLAGTLNKVNTKNLNYKELFSTNGDHKELSIFKESLRNIRYAIESSDSQTFLFTSTKPAEGKTFLIVSLAYALTLKNKKVLLIDTNFKNNTLTKMSNNAQRRDLLTSRLIGESNLDHEFESKNINTQFDLKNVDIIGNKGTSFSPSEIFAGHDFGELMAKFKEHYDYIFLEGASLNKYSDTKELVEFAEKIILVFSAKSELKQLDYDSIDFIKSLNGKLLGAILNKVNLKNLQ